MMKSLKLLLALCVFFAACHKQEQQSDMASVYSAYYWTTVFELSKTKEEFMAKNQIKRLYLRFFDVVPGPDGMPIPNATVKFKDEVPDTLQIIPTVYVMNECLNADTEVLAENIVSRVMKMCATHQVQNVNEIQIDCDWTKTTQRQYFDFLKTVKEKLSERNIALSVTIRLHQLAYQSPPADKGVLMVYNTGDLTDPNCRNPILDPDDVEPFLKYLKTYELELAAAYPVFSWKLLFRGETFRGIWHYEGEFEPMAGDTLIDVAPTVEDIRMVENRIGQVNPNTNHEIIIYDLSDKNIESIGFPF